LRGQNIFRFPATQVALYLRRAAQSTTANADDAASGIRK
jgi:hypothetical protein